MLRTATTIASGLKFPALCWSKLFQETYGLELQAVLINEDKALNSYRRDVSKFIPKATRIAGTQERRD